MLVFICGDRYEDIMSCIYDAWIYAVEHDGHDSVRIEKESGYEINLFDECIYTKSDSDKAYKLTESIKKKISNLAYIWVYRAAMSASSDAPDAIYRFLLTGFKNGYRVTDMLTDKSVMKLMEINRRIGNELHHFIEFVRFTSKDGRVYISHIEPKNNVVELLASHFEERMPSENFIIVDDLRKLAAVHPQDDNFYLKSLTEDEYIELLAYDEHHDIYTDMWKTFFNTIAIKQRNNPKCQRNLFPVWLRKHVTEFNN